MKLMSAGEFSDIARFHTTTVSSASTRPPGQPACDQQQLSLLIGLCNFVTNIIKQSLYIQPSTTTHTRSGPINETRCIFLLFRLSFFFSFLALVNLFLYYAAWLDKCE
jgi:hypothetical protein